MMAWIGYDTMFDTLRSEPRFNALLKKVNLSDKRDLFRLGAFIGLLAHPLNRPQCCLASLRRLEVTDEIRSIFSSREMSDAIIWKISGTKDEAI